MRWWRLAVWAGFGAALACGAGSHPSGDVVPPGSSTSNGGPGPIGNPPPDAGGSPPDAGTPPDGGAPDGSVAWTPAAPIDFPTAPGWTFYGPQNGGPHDVYQVTADEGGNIWVAGGEDGLFLLRPGETTFERFTMADGLRPYGYLPDGSDPIGPKFLKVIAVTGGPAGTVFVGYEGLPGCENAWDTAANRPTATNPGLAYVYKSGDADKVSLTATGIDVVHYDIFSGPGLVSAEPEGREKLCTIYRIGYDAKTNNLWFGGNHGFALGDATYAGDPACNGEPACSGVAEHSHPAFNGCSTDNGCGNWVFITEDYRGVALAPDGDVWFGGADRTTKFHWSAFGGARRDRFMAAATLTEYQGDGTMCPNNAYPCYIQDRIDVWPDLKGETTGSEQPPLPSERIEDLVFGIAAMPDGSVYVGSGWLGLRHLDQYGKLISDETARLTTKAVGAVVRDPFDGSVWVGNRYAGGIARLQGSATTSYGLDVFGKLANMGIEDIQFDPGAAQRKVLVGFRAGGGTSGFIAVYQGN